MKKTLIISAFIVGVLGLIVLMDTQIICRPHSMNAQVQADMRLLTTALKAFKLQYGRYPTQEEGLEILWQEEKGALLPNYPKGGFLLESPKDPWGNSYQYSIDSSSEKNDFILWSNGDPNSKNADIIYAK
ncbi:type II secretion system protein GspG [Sessilibacter sp. MAH2]